jgi:N-acetylglucosamine-6-phosphate deacetylase
VPRSADQDESVAGRVVTPEGVVDGAVRVVGGRILAIEAGTTAATGGSGGRRWVVPGFVDLHTHGGGGYDLTTGHTDAAARAAAFHLRHGTTTLLASLVSGPYDRTLAAIAGLAPLTVSGELAGVHLEGPYLSPERCGAHDPAYLRHPSPDALARLVDACRGAVRMVTLAPELPGAREAIALLADRGVVAAAGHTDASYAQTRDAVTAGVRVATHLGNGMRPVHHREPGPVVALLGAPEVVCEVIADGVHLHPGMLAWMARVAGPDRVALVTDATAAAGMPDGGYDLASRRVVVAGGVARLATPDGSPGALAGSTLTMDAALRGALAAGVSIVDAVRMAATTPARVLGLTRTVGALAVGLRADLVVLDDDLRVVRVMRAGTWVAP